MVQILEMRLTSLNRVFNRGWEKAQGIWEREKYSEGSIAPKEPSNFVNFGGKGKYSDPEFTWRIPVGVTSIRFWIQTN